MRRAAADPRRRNKRSSAWSFRHRRNDAEVSDPRPRVCRTAADPSRRRTAMTTLTDRPHTALLVIDVQNDVVRGAHRRDSVVAAIAVLVGKARAAGVPVVWVQHSSDEM